MTTPPPLTLITALARAGALGQALRLYDDGGYALLRDDPAALAVQGRLLKDQALSATGRERIILFAKAADAYKAADAITPQPYLLINVATLYTLGGEPARGAALAVQVLERLKAPDIADTPYWIAATRAEALLLRGDIAGCDAALSDAAAHDPDGWSDRASTLRQLRLICEAGALDCAWMGAHRPPASLHYAGHLGITAADGDALSAALTKLIGEDRIGFGYGALAAGADIIIAEWLIARGAALHIVLPTPKEAFIAQSITPYGDAWRVRFDTCIAAAASIRQVTQVNGAYEPLAMALASDVAMGAARLNAAMLESYAQQLLIIDEGAGEFGTGIGTARDGAAWKATLAPQKTIIWPRSAPVAASAGRREGRGDLRMLALLMVSFKGLDKLGEGDFARALDGKDRDEKSEETDLGGMTYFWAQADLLTAGGGASQPCGNARIFRFGSAAAAARFAQQLRDLQVDDSNCPLTIAGHYGLVHQVLGSYTGSAVAMLDAISQVSLPGSFTVSENFASTLSLSSYNDLRAEYVGDIEAPGGEMLLLFGLSGLIN